MSLTKMTKTSQKKKNDPVQGATPEVIPNLDASYPEPEKFFSH
jgi:hypothetical protein